MTRRPSLVGPTLLVLVGAGLLAANLREDLSVATLFANYWPWLLVAWGGFRILEHAVAWARDSEGPEPAGSGAVMTALLLCFLGGTFHAAESGGFAARLSEGFHEIFSRSVHSFPMEERRFTAPAGEALTIAELRGRLDVRPGEGDELVLSGSTSVERRIEERARQIAEQADVRLDGERLVFGRPEQLSYRAKLAAPADRRLELTNFDGRVDVADWRGAIDAEGRGRLIAGAPAGPVAVRFTRPSALEVRGAQSAVSLDGSARSVEIIGAASTVKLNGNLLDDVRIEGVEGEVDVVSKRSRVRAGSLPGRLHIEDEAVEATGAAGGLEIEGKGHARIRVVGGMGDVRVFAERGRIELAPPPTGAGNWSARIEKGDIELVAPEGGRFQIIARGEPGRVEFEDFAGEPEKLSDGRLKFGSVGPTIELRAGEGSIRIRVDEAPEPPEPVETPTVERL